ncbi:MAG TPA: mucoidy inhibitor MuiA family protein [Planctomycetota bacterium]|nr:mucoidy inhibitor MuiA family protein [Planctomycetota bacterium]
MPTLALLLALAPQAGTADRTLLVTRVEEVTVFPGQALVRRVGTAPGGVERLVIEGLPLSIDTSSLRASCTGGEVVALETRTRLVREVPEERLRVLRERLKELGRQRESTTDERALADDVKGHLQRLLQVEEAEHARDLERARMDAELWSANLAYIRERLGEARRTLREIEWRLEDLDGEIDRVRDELERSQGSSGSQRIDVWIDLVARGGAAPEVSLEYLAGGAGWAPLYDLRTAGDARSVELAYRAQVSQRTGEDWNDCEVLLSTARPQLGAQGPEPQPIWLSLYDTQQGKFGGRGAAARLARELGDDGSDEFFLGAGESVAPAFATVEAQGLSVRYRLPRRETIQSRVEPTTVLVGSARLEARPEYHVTPSLDLNVWLRGVATNSSPWTLLPGRASVFFGADYVGAAQVGLVQPGAELVLHLGADPNLVAERAQTEDMNKGPGLFGSRQTQNETWRVTLENHGAAAANADGSVEVFVSEALPRSTDERISVELAKSSPKPLEGERWKKDFDEKGVHVWRLSAARSGEAVLEYQVKVSYPQGGVLVR